MAQTVTEVLTAATDSVTLINAINGGTHEVSDMTQEEINEMVQRNVDHLEIILAYDGTNNTPDVAGDASDKSSYTDAITTGKAYIAAN
jgi:putative aminopeptidase FrvX